MNNKLSPLERNYLALIKAMPCSVCNAPGPSDAHHIEQNLQYISIPLCRDCHQGSHNGIHGRKSMWKVMKKTEMSALNETIREIITSNCIDA